MSAKMLWRLLQSKSCWLHDSELVSRRLLQRASSSGLKYAG